MIVLKNIPIILFSIIICSHALAVEPRTKLAVQVEGEDTEFEQYLSVLKMPWHEKRRRSEELQEAITKLALMGDEIIEPIMNTFNRHDQTFAFRHKAVQVLEQLSTEKAREALLEIALGSTKVELKSSLKTWASRAYIETLANKAKASRLLVSDDTGVLNNALLALKGQVVDDAVLKRLVELLKSKEVVLRWAAASVLAEDPRPNIHHASKRIAAIIDAIGQVETLPERREDVVFMSGLDMSDHEGTYMHYINCMAKMPGGWRTLWYKTRYLSVSGKTYDSVIIARAMRGDSLVRDDILKILKDANAGMFRAWAARALGSIGLQDDITVLSQLASNDPLRRKRFNDVGPDREKMVFPVREAAQEAIRQIERSQAIKDESDWGEPREGLRCRWVRPREPIIAGTDVALAVEVQNISSNRIFWECCSQITWDLDILPGPLLGMPKFYVKSGQGTRQATQKEVRERFGVGLGDDRYQPEAPMPGYYYFEPDGKLKLIRELLWKPENPGAYRMECEVFRYSPVTSMKWGEAGRMVCPPLTLNVKANKPDVQVEGEADNFAQAEKVSEPKPSFFPPMTTLTQGDLKPLLEKWDKAIESEKFRDTSKIRFSVTRYVSEDMRCHGSYVLAYSNPEIINRIVGLYLKECAKVDQPIPPDRKSETNPWYGGEAGAEYMISLMTVAESTFDPRIYETEMMHIGVTGELRLLYLATVNPEKTLKYLLESKRGYRVGTKKGHPDYFYHGRTAWGMSVRGAYTLLSLMCVQSPTILNRHRDRVLSFVKEHVKYFASPRTVSYKTEPVYPKMRDYDVRNGALDILKLLGAVEDVELVEEIVRDAPQLEPKKLKGGPRDRREQIQQKGERVIGLIRRRQKTQDR